MSVKNKPKIIIAVNGIKVVSVESNTKINIAVNGVHVSSVESNAKINIAVNGVHVVSVESLIALRLIAVTVTAHHSTSKHCLLWWMFETACLL